MGEMVAEAMLAEGLDHLTVIHRIEKRAEALARTLNCHAANFDDLEKLLDEADIVLTALGSRRHVLSADMMLVAVHRRRKKPVFLVDTSLPGDIDPAINRIEEAFLYDLADLEGVVMAGRATRESVAQEAAMIVEEEIGNFLKGLSTHSQVLRCEVYQLKSPTEARSSCLIRRAQPREPDGRKHPGSHPEDHLQDLAP